MSSIRKIQSARANGARSRGPKTPEGKRRSSQNAMRHGLLAKCVVLEGESRRGFEQLLQFHIERFGPLDGVEFGMVEEMASAYWRLRRLWAIENRMMEDAVPDPDADQIGRITAAFNALAGSPQYRLLHRYQATLHRMYQRALDNLLLLRDLCETNRIPNSDTPEPPTPGPQTASEPEPEPGPDPEPEADPGIAPEIEPGASGLPCAQPETPVDKVSAQPMATPSSERPAAAPGAGGECGRRDPASRSSIMMSRPRARLSGRNRRHGFRLRRLRPQSLHAPAGPPPQAGLRKYAC